MSQEIPEAPTGGADARTLAASLAPLIIESCEGRLSEIRWFKADWQRGGAATAIASYTDDDGERQAVVVKLPIGERELTWTRRLQRPGRDGVIARLFASGDVLGGYDLAWIVIERFEYGPLGKQWHEGHIPRICEAAARFYESASAFPIDHCPLGEDWSRHLKDASRTVKLNKLEHHQRWNKAIKALRSKLDTLTAAWDSRDTNQWVHGDLHLANAMCRADGDEAPVSLIDLSEVRAGHWIEDAVYLERQLWAAPRRLRPHSPVRTLAKARKALGLPVESDYPRLAMIRRALLAATAPRFIRSEGHPRYLEACLERLERSLNDLS